MFCFRERHLHFQPLCLSALLAIFGFSHATAAQDAPRFYENKAQGWFWYEPEPVEPDPTPPPTEPEPVIVSVPEPTPPAAPAPFSAEWMRVNLPKYKDMAWDNPTLENVRAYMYMQRFAVDRSEQFSRVSELAVLGDPFLDEINRRPLADYGAHQVERQAGMSMDATIADLAKKSGLFFFFKSGELYSEAQAPIVWDFQRQTGFEILPISADGKPLSDNMYPDFQPDNGHSAELNILSYPAFFLVSEDGDIEPVAQGMLAVSDIKSRILIAAHRMGLITDPEFEKTRSVIPVGNDLSKLLTRKDTADTVFTNRDSDNFVEPSELMRQIKLALDKKGD